MYDAHVLSRLIILIANIGRVSIDFMNFKLN